MPKNSNLDAASVAASAVSLFRAVSLPPAPAVPIRRDVILSILKNIHQ